MHISCIICSDLIAPHEEIFSTTCGHMFHFNCLERWISRSKTCPHCRNKVSDKSIHRVYFNIPSTEGVDEDVVVLQSRLDSMAYQMKLKDTDIKNIKEKNETLTFQNEGQRGEVKNLESKIRTMESAMFALKEQIQYFKQRSKDSDKLHGEIRELKDKVRMAGDLEIAINGSMDQVRQMVANNIDVQSLSIMNCTLKQQLIDTDKRLRHLNSKATKIKSDMNVITRENVDLRNEVSQIKSELQEHLGCNKLKQLLKSKIAKLQKQLETGTESPNNSIRRILTESPAPAQASFNEANLEIEVDSPTVSERVQAIKDSDSPYLPVTNHSAPIQSLLNAKFSLPYDKLTTKNPERIEVNKFSTLRHSSDKPRLLSTSSLVYDGFGGHSNYEVFPSPIASRSIALKRPKSSSSLPSSKFRKLSSQNNKLMDYFKQSPKKK